MAKGLVYFAKNPAFQHLTKIGKTTKVSVEDRGLSASNVPEDFDYLAVLECEDCDWVEEKIHEQFKQFRHFTALKKRKTEFFWSGCIEDAIKYAKDLKGVKDVTDKNTEKVSVTVDGEKQIIRRPNTTFAMIGLKKGTKIFYKNNPDDYAIVEDDKNHVSYKGQQKTAISNISNEKMNCKTNGFEYFYYNGVRLWDMRPDVQDK